MPGGRPSKYSPQLADEICVKISSGQSLRDICKDDGVPSTRTIFSWINEATVSKENGENNVKIEFLHQYELALANRAHGLADEIIAIADDSEDDYGFKDDADKDGEGAKPVFLAEHVQRSRLRVDARKWVASKLLPKKYGDFARNELTGRDGGPIEISIPQQIEEVWRQRELKKDQNG